MKTGEWRIAEDNMWGVKNHADMREVNKIWIRDIREIKNKEDKCWRLTFFLWASGIGRALTRKDFDKILDMVELTSEEFKEYEKNERKTSKKVKILEWTHNLYFDWFYNLG